MKNFARWIPAVLLMTLSSCSYQLADLNRKYMSDATEIRMGAVGDGYLVSRKGNMETIRFRNLLHDKGSPRIVELVSPINRNKNSTARLQEVSEPFEPGNKTRYTIRMVDGERRMPPNRDISVDSNEFIISANSSEMRLFIGKKGNSYANHHLFTHLHKVRRSETLASLRNLGYVATIPPDLIIIPAGLFYLSVDSSIRSAF